MGLELAENVIPFRPEPADSRILSTHVPFGHALFWEGEEARQLFKIEAGVVRGVNFSAEGERQVTGFFFAGDVIGLPSGGQYRYTAEAVTDVRYSTKAVDCWTEELRRTAHPDETVFGAIGPELEASYMRSLLIGQQGALARISAFLAYVCGQLDEREDAILPMPQTDIAAYLSLTPETVCRAFRTLKETGAVRIEKHDRIRIVDLARITSLATH
ncbi:MAG: Crp/Fnr family transcriptional regulator [Parasphingopyxis sp.]|uniref:Crp/Fnr family transcriptional regulator n=1 Tax=Parasphingopyxis sp. TaxID=1920299 RepID=UPI003FA06F22